MAPEEAHTLKLKAHEGAQRMESLQLIKTSKFEIFIYFRATSKKSQNWGTTPEVAHTLKLKAHESAQHMESLY
jgi:hypothetical protein